jgi:hypothetical protein
MSKQTKELLPVSPSRAKTLQNCSFLYYCNVYLKLPEKTNLGALRGSGIHHLLELLCLPRHQNLIDALIQTQNPDKVRPIRAFLDNQIKKLKIPPNELVKPISNKDEAKTNREELHAMLMTVVNQELSKTNYEFIATEYNFDFVENNTRLKGFIDRVTAEGDTCVISDWKMSSKRFVGEELTSNLQAMVYSLVARKIWPQYKKYIVRFFFARFPKQPYQELEFSKEELDGLVHYLKYISEIMNGMDEKSACNNFAVDNPKTKWLCGAGPTWRCPYRDPFDYWQIVESKSNKIIKTGFLTDEPPETKIGEKLEIKSYLGCPRHKNS